MVYLYRLWWRAFVTGEVDGDKFPASNWPGSSTISQHKRCVLNNVLYIVYIMVPCSITLCSPPRVPVDRIIWCDMQLTVVFDAIYTNNNNNMWIYKAHNVSKQAESEAKTASGLITGINVENCEIILKWNSWCWCHFLHFESVFVIKSHRQRRTSNTHHQWQRPFVAREFPSPT